MEYKFITSEADSRLPAEHEISGINRFLLENCSKQLKSICNFFQNKNHLMLINGFMGTGKSTLLNHVLNCISDDVIVLKYNCFETTILDDVLLTFFEEFRKLTALEKIEPPRIKSENFTKKINSYFESIKQPIVVVFDSFDNILKQNRTEIIEFINYICNLDNIKVFLVGRNFDYSEINIKFDKTTVLAFEKTIFEKYLRSEDVKNIGPLSDELYKQTRGYYFYTSLSLKIMKIKNWNMVDFLDNFSKSFLNFNDFILREALSLVDPISGHLFRFLTIIRHPISIKLLKLLQLYDNNRVLFFINNDILSSYGEYIYLPDYFREISENSITNGVAIKLHKGCIDLYHTQLPLKPLERDLMISRQTMRNEIEYHSNFMPKKVVLKREENTNVTKTQEEEVKIDNTPLDIIEQKNEQIKKMSFIFEDDDTGVLDKIADSIKDFLDLGNQRIQEENEENTLTLIELINKAKQKEAAFEYKHAISIYLKALAHKDDVDYYMFLPTIYNNIAELYKNLSDWFNAQKYLELAIEFYSTTGDDEKVNQIRYSIANICYLSFKRNKAKEILLDIKENSIDNELQIKVNVLLANLISDSNEVYNLYKHAISLASINTEKVLLAELYYKFASENENQGFEDIAAEYYKKCINLNIKNNPYLTRSLNNIALLYDDIGETKLAIKCYTESLKIDEQNKNIDGLHSTTMKLAEIYSTINSDQAIAYFNKALEYAKTLKDDFYLLATHTAFGDFYFNREDNSSAYKHFQLAYEYSIKSTTKENTEKILLRISEIKLRLGDERFKELEQQKIL